MASETIQLEIVTPTGVALRQKVDDVTAPSVAGEFGVLPGHLPVLAALRTGLVTYQDDLPGSTEYLDSTAQGFRTSYSGAVSFLGIVLDNGERVEAQQTNGSLGRRVQRVMHRHGRSPDG